MRFKVNSQLSYNVKAATTFVFSIQVLETRQQKIIAEDLTTSLAALKIENFTLGISNARHIRLHVPKPCHFSISYKAEVDLQLQPINIRKKASNEIQTVPYHTIALLFPSRYCQVDQLYKFADIEFGSIKTEFQKVTAISNWVYKNVNYVSGSSDANTSAVDIITQREGVCRDFAHLCIVLCRALNIPARYFVGYAYQLNPPDFHACFEAFVNGRWLLFDATKMVPLNGLIKTAHGLDASDTSFANIYGDAEGLEVNVSCEVVNKKAFDAQAKKMKLFSYD